ncbi:hypothetical protein DPMN_177253 [Dreissena polymorpha]|uniref:Uncharacterized protein n=1 Tax=Dreissena polymorpha TaxID=45954 RepID=A0A9D4EBD7_DREPO|nr:hypothetical protein DPMN_177253 [Dreissena polymorpha]
MIGVKKHVDNLTSMFTDHQKNADSIFAEDIFGPALKTAKDIGVTLTIPRQCGRQVHRANVGGTSDEYYRRTIYIPHMDSLIQSLGSRFSESNMPAFMLYQLHPNHIKHFDRSNYKDTVRSINEFYQIDNFEQDAMSWYDTNKKESIKQNESDFVDLVKKRICFQPCVRR